MIFDKPEHRAFLLELLQAAQYPGHVLDLAFEVKQAVKNAQVKSDELRETEAPQTA